ncbi:MAG: hypothetical protein QM586_06250 [Xenophilus sp.]
MLPPLEHPNPARFDAPAILKKLVGAHRSLAELKGVAASMPRAGQDGGHGGQIVGGGSDHARASRAAH